MQLSFETDKPKYLSAIRYWLTGRTPIDPMGEKKIMMLEEGFDIKLNGSTRNNDGDVKSNSNYIRQLHGAIVYKHCLTQGQRRRSNSAHATNGFVTDETSPDEFFRRLDNAEVDATNGLVTDESNSTDESDANSSCGTSANEFFRQLDAVEVDVSKENLTRADQIHKVHLVYSICNRNNGNLGGGGYGSSIGGELSKQSMQKTVDVMVKYQELNEKSVVINLGSGMGMPNFHFAQCGVALSVGIEIESPRYLLSVANLHKVLMEANKNKLDIGTNCYFVHADIEQITSLYGVTHCYTFCKGMQEKNLSQHR